ncbi:MAG: hypothetical protein II921_10495 [Treponema sp.]|nr:hypothetical protein [Treponema sp.]
MKKLRIVFDGFWRTFNPHDNFIVRALKTNFDVEVLPVGEKSDIDALFYSVYSYHCLEYDCPRIFFTGENAFPDFNICDYGIGFELHEIGDRFFRYPVSLADFHRDYEDMEQKNNSVPQNPFHRKFCAQVVSNVVYTDGFRDAFFNELCKYKQVDSGGRHLNNIGMPGGVPDKREFLENYKFSLAFENVGHPGYCTEKITQSFAAHTIPIYWGDPNVADYFNEKSFININSFNTIEDAIEYIKKIDNDESLYLSMLNEPAVIAPAAGSEHIDKEFSAWLRAIFDQPKEKRYRKSSFGYEKMYTNQQQLMLNMLKIKHNYTFFGKAKKAAFRILFGFWM